MTLPQGKYGHSSWLTKRIEEQKKLKSRKKLEFSKKKLIWYELYRIIEIDFELMNSICLFSINNYLLKYLMKSIEKWSLLTSCLAHYLLFYYFYRCWRIKMIQDMNRRVIRSRISILLFSVESLIEFDVRTMNHCFYWDIKEKNLGRYVLDLNYWLIILLLLCDSMIRCLAYLWGELPISLWWLLWPSAHNLVWRSW